MKYSISLPQVTFLTHPGIYQFGKPVIGLCLPFRASYINGKRLDEKKKQIIKNWCVRKNLPIHKDSNTSDKTVKINKNGLISETINTSIAVLWYTSCLLNRKLDMQEMHSLFSTLFHKNEMQILTSIASLHGGISFSRREFSFLKQASFLPLKIPEKWTKSLYLVNTNRIVDWEKEILHFRSYYNSNTQDARQLLDQTELTVKRYITSLASEQFLLFRNCFQTFNLLNPQFDIGGYESWGRAMPLFMLRTLWYFCLVDDKRVFQQFCKKNNFTIIPYSNELAGIQWEDKKTS